MATLEVHDDRGRVQFVELARDHPVLFGTSAACDIVLAGDGVAPVHGRIRWKKGRFKVEASPGAEYVVLNGRKMASSSLRQGDEMTVGACRIYVFRLDEDLEARPSRTARHPDEERTRVLEGPPPQAPAPAGRHRAAPSRTTTAPGSLLERSEWLEELGLDEKKAPNADGEDATTIAPGGGRRARSAAGKQASPGRLGRWWRALRDERADAPGQERLVSSPLVVGLVASLALLVALGLGLRWIIAKTSADRDFNRAMTAMEDGDYRNALRGFDRFLEEHPKDPRAGKARLRRAMANVRQYISVSGGTWSNALKAAREMFEQHGSEEEFRDEQVELAEQVIRIGEGLADRARRSADAKSLEEAEQSVPLHARIAGEPAPDFLKRSRLPGLIDQARAAVRKAQDRQQALSRMDEALQGGSAAGVYKARDALVERYADLSQDPELIKRMTRANDLVRKAVKVARDRRAAATDTRPEVLGPPTSLVLRSVSTSPSGPPAAESIVCALADGLAYAIDGATGSPLWQRFVGLASPFVPQSVAGTGSFLAVDARHDELLRLDSRDGRLIWRLALGEPVDSPPLALGEQLFQVLPSGKLLLIALGSGEVQATVDLGLRLGRSPASDEQGRHLYLVARRDCLFVLARDSLQCLAVEYLGHEEDSIPCPPLRAGRFLIVPENDRPADGRWRVLVLDDDGAKVRPVQRVNVPGWTWSVPAASGAVLWATGDRGGVEAYALGDYASKNPLRLLARLDPDAASSGPAFGLATSERELWVSAARSGQFELDPERGQIAARSALGKTGPAVAPLQLAGKTVVATYQDPETGGTSLYGLDSASGSTLWQTILGAGWPSALEPGADGAALVSLGQNGKELTIPAETLRRGGFAALGLPRPGDLKLPAGSVLRLKEQGRVVSLLAPRAGASRVWVQAADEPSGWRSVDLPSALAAPPLVWDRGLLVPGADGRVYLIDPLSARSIAEPYVPDFSRDRQGRWRAPSWLSVGAVILADDAGRVRILGRLEKPIARLTVEVEKGLDKAIVADPIGIGDALLVVTADQQVRALAARDLSAVGAWPLESPLVDRPVVAGGRGFVCDAGGGVMAFGRDGQRRWAIRLDAPAAGPPRVAEGLVWFLDREGRLHGRSLADGSPRRRIELGIAPAGGLLGLGGQAIVPVARGTLQPLALDALPASSADPRPPREPCTP
jgi:outer membrane protein assembly factor BamB